MPQNRCSRRSLYACSFTLCYHPLENLCSQLSVILRNFKICSTHFGAEIIIFFKQLHLPYFSCFVCVHMQLSNVGIHLFCAVAALEFLELVSHMFLSGGQSAGRWDTQGFIFLPQTFP